MPNTNILLIILLLPRIALFALSHVYAKRQAKMWSFSQRKIENAEKKYSNTGLVHIDVPTIMFLMKIHFVCTLM